MIDFCPAIPTACVLCVVTIVLFCLRLRSRWKSFSVKKKSIYHRIQNPRRIWRVKKLREGSRDKGHIKCDTFFNKFFLKIPFRIVRSRVWIIAATHRHNSPLRADFFSVAGLLFGFFRNNFEFIMRRLILSIDRPFFAATLWLLTA